MFTIMVAERQFAYQWVTYADLQGMMCVCVHAENSGLIDTV